MSGESEDKKEKFREAAKMAFVVGATGEIGKELVKALLTERLFSRVVLFGRRQVTYEDEIYKNVEQKIINFDKLEDHVDEFRSFDVGYSCLGTTKGKSGADGFYKVDHDYVVNTAKLALDGGCKQFHLISAAGASASSFFLYPKTKGQVEEEIKAMKFDNLFIYRPGLLLCDREEQRSGEKAFDGQTNYLYVSDGVVRAHIDGCRGNVKPYRLCGGWERLGGNARQQGNTSSWNQGIIRRENC